MFFIENLPAQIGLISIESDSSHYKIIKGEPRIFKLEINSNSKKEIEILDVWNAETDSGTVNAYTYAEIYYKSKGKYKEFKCSIDINPLGGFHSRFLSVKKMTVITRILPDCISFKGDYKVRLYVSYRMKGSAGSQRAGSNWFNLRVD